LLTESNRYVDEVQDNLLIDTLGMMSFIFHQVLSNPTTVLRAINRNSTGLFWAGDTAQTISVGSSFRFNDLKAFQHRIEVKCSWKFL